MLEEAGRHFLRQKLFSLHTAQMKSMMLGVMESQDYRQTLIRNCKSIIWPTTRHYPREVLEQIDWDDAVKCAEALGKRNFILEVLPASALDLVIDRTAPEKKGVRALLNEWEEFSAYTVFPEYKKDSYLERFTLPMLLDIMGFQRILRSWPGAICFKRTATAMIGSTLPAGRCWPGAAFPGRKQKKPRIRRPIRGSK